MSNTANGHRAFPVRLPSEGRRRAQAGAGCPRPTIDPSSTLFHKLLRRSHPGVFLAPHVTFDFRHHHSRHERHDPPPPPPSSSESVTTPYAAKRLRSLPRREGGSAQELSLVRRWLAVLCISSASICVTCASSTVRCDGSLDEDALLTSCDMCICRQNSRNLS